MTLNLEHNDGSSKNCKKGEYFCKDDHKCKPIPKGHHVMPDGKLMKGDKHSMNEVAPPTKKHERMVKHIKKSYGKDGGLSDEEKSIAYATAWKNYNKKETFDYEKLKKKIGSKEKHMKPVIAETEYGKLKGYQKSVLQGGLKVRSGLSYDKEMARLVKMYPGFKVEEKEMTYQEAIDAGWEMTGEGIWWPPQDTETVSEKMSFKSFRGVLDKKKKKEEKKPEKAMDAGAKAKRKLARKAHAKYVSGSEDNVPDDIRDHKEFNT